MSEKMRLKKSIQGFTIVELIVTLTILGFVLAGFYTLYFYMQSNFNRTDARSAVNQEINLALMQMDRDIRSASKPNAYTQSVRVIFNEEIHIYSYDSSEKKYVRIAYRLNPDDLTLLQRGTVVCPTEKPTNKKEESPPLYGEITEWKTILKGVIGTSVGKTFGFEDVTNPSGKDRRKIKITLIANDARNTLPKPVVITKYFTSRSIRYPESP